VSALDGQIALVTGSTRGIGAGIAVEAAWITGLVIDVAVLV
jgi:NAD(P)-dependent dehydrogenase (short-subunit alcohol dehydrogenase family)